MSARFATRTRGSDIGNGDTLNGGDWSHRRLMLVLMAAAGVAVVLLAGLGYGLVIALGASPDGSGNSGLQGVNSTVDMHSEVAGGRQRRDEIAAARLAEVPPKAMNPTDGKVEPPDAGSAITIPSGIVPGPALVLTGFPHTPEGAVGQLAAIETTVLQSMSLNTSGDVYQAWALPGGAGPDAWPLTTSVRAFLGATGMGEEKDTAATVVVEPAAALVKGTDGPDWTLACVLVVVTATIEQEAQGAYGHCERMQWVGGRWMIASGAAPATAPSTWPETPAAVEAGWRPWVTSAGAGES